MKTFCKISTTCGLTGYLNQDDQGNLSIGNQAVSQYSIFNHIVIHVDTNQQICDIKTLEKKLFSGELFSMPSCYVLMNANKVNSLTDLLNKLNITHCTIPQQYINITQVPAQINIPKQIQITNKNQVTNNIQNNNSASYAGSNTHHGVTKYTQGKAPVTVLDQDNDLATRLKHELEKHNGFELTKHPEIKIQSLSDGSINIYDGFSYLRVNRKDLDDGTCKSLIEYIKNNNVKMFKKMSLSYKGSEQYGYKTVHTGMQIKGQKDRCCPGQCNIF